MIGGASKLREREKWREFLMMMSLKENLMPWKDKSISNRRQRIMNT
jgi:hypothetical protein